MMQMYLEVPSVTIIVFYFMLLPRGDDLLKYRLLHFVYFIKLLNKTNNKRRIYSLTNKDLDEQLKNNSYVPPTKKIKKF